MSILIFFNYLIDFLVNNANLLIDWFYNLVVSGFAYLIEIGTYLSLKASYNTLLFAHDVALQIIADIKLNETLQSIYNQIPSIARNTLDFLGIPAMLQQILSASVTRFVMGKIGGF